MCSEPVGSAVLQALEERCQQQALLTARLMEKRSGNMSFNGSQPLNFGLNASSGPCCKADMPVERRNRSMLPPSSRNARLREQQARAALPAQRSHKVQERAGYVAGDYEHGVVHAEHHQSDQDALKSWGSTGKRQPARPRARS